MYIYKITVEPISQVYIGLDTKDSKKLSRWKEHLKECQKKQETKLQKALFKYGPDSCTIEIIHDNVQSIFELMCLEVEYIKEYDSYRNGLNSTQGGDGWGHRDLHLLTEEEINILKNNFGKTMRDYNNNVKWANKTKEERLELLRSKMFLTPQAIAKRAATLKDWYAEDPSRKEVKLAALKKWRDTNAEKSKENCRKNGAKAAAKTGKPIRVKFPDETIKIYQNQQIFKRETKIDPRYILNQTKQGLHVKGYQAWFIEKDNIK